jgi:hypothetical protein
MGAPGTVIYYELIRPSAGAFAAGLVLIALAGTEPAVASLADAIDTLRQAGRRCAQMVFQAVPPLEIIPRIRR